jgi:hypothetical protein
MLTVRAPRSPIVDQPTVALSGQSSERQREDRSRPEGLHRLGAHAINFDIVEARFDIVEARRTDA